MHQQIRPSRRDSSPANSPQTNLARTNNPREAPVSRPRAGSGFSTTAAAARDVGAASPTTPDLAGFGGMQDETIKKLDQIIQNVHAKAAALILSSRMVMRPSKTANGQIRTSKWFQAETEDFDDFREDLKIWRTCGSFDNRPPPLFIEIYLDASQLRRSESLVLVDDDGKRWDVVEALNASYGSSDSGNQLKRNTQVVLERWRIELKQLPVSDHEDFGVVLPTIYKKGIVFIRSIYTYIHLLPAWRLVKESRTRKNTHPALIPKCRIRPAEPDLLEVDCLRQPLTGKVDSVAEYVFGDLDVLIGRFYASVTYRTEANCNFRVDDTESLLSSRFMGVDENFFPPTFQKHEPHHRDDPMNMLPSHRKRPDITTMQQAYGSLSTFHGDNPLSTSPMTALRQVKQPGSDTSSPPGSVPASVEPDPPHSLPTRPRPRGSDDLGRRPSLSFNPFRAGTLSGSPVARQDSESPASPQSFNRIAGLPALSQARNRKSLTAGMPASLRGAPVVAEQSQASSPRTASGSRYSSSFTHRKGRPSFGGASRAGEDEQGSSGRQSLSSSVAQPGSGFLAEAVGTSSGSLNTSDDNIAEFIKVLESKRTLKSFDLTSKRNDAATNRTVAQLSRFQMMKESNNALTESMTSSMQMPRSPLTSLSTSSSPGRPLGSPHATHTPAVPSRLSENSIADGSSKNARSSTPRIIQTGPSRESTVREDKDRSSAIDIPVSPRLGSRARRSSSVAHQSRSAAVEDDDNEPDPVFLPNRSISLGADSREPPTVGSLLRRQEERDDSPAEADSTGLQPAAEIHSGAGGVDMMRDESSEGSSKPPSGLIHGPGSSSPFGRRRYTSMAARNAGQGTGYTTPQSGRGSFSGRSGRGGCSVGGGGDLGNDEEPLLFDMSEVDAQGRRSIEENGGGSNVGGTRGGGYGPPGKW